jgi:tetratricopeptide (TPR) repeat protein
MPANQSTDLDAEKDVWAFAIMASETDKVFSGNWLGTDIAFFRPDQVQPERHSRLMRDVFKKHIYKVEQAVRLDPLNWTLWNIWAWMAQCLPDYKWDSFINTIEPSMYPYMNSYRVFPPSNVSAWIIEEARAKKDWATVAKFAKAAQRFSAVFTDDTTKIEWMPGGSTAFAERSEYVKDYPAKAYAAHLEALLRLGSIDEANALFDEMIRREGKTDKYSHSLTVGGKTERYRANNALLAANAARAAGMEDLAKTWEEGEQINQVPYVQLFSELANGFPSWYHHAESGESYSNGFSAITNRLAPRLPMYSTSNFGLEMMSWKKEDGDRWALIGGDLSVMEQGYGMPEPEILQAILNRKSIKDEAGYRRSYMAEHGARPGLEVDLAFTIFGNNVRALERQRDQGANADPSEDIWAEACSLLNRVLANNPEILINMPSPWTADSSMRQSQAMKSLSVKLLANIEMQLERKPSSGSLWTQWLFWRYVENAERAIEPIVESVKTSPISKPSTVPPGIAINAYYEECRRNGKWPKVISLLKMVWDREFTRIAEIQKTDPSFKVSEVPTNQGWTFNSVEEYEARLAQQNSRRIGDDVAIPLIEAYLNDGKPFEAKEIFNAWLGCGGTFKDISKIVAAAKAQGQERLAQEWEEKMKK